MKTERQIEKDNREHFKDMRNNIQPEADEDEDVYLTDGCWIMPNGEIYCDED